MKAQWQLIDIETKEILARFGDPFDVIPELIKDEWERQCKGFEAKEPFGIVNLKGGEND